MINFSRVQFPFPIQYLSVRARQDTSLGDVQLTLGECNSVPVFPSRAE